MESPYQPNPHYVLPYGPPPGTQYFGQPFGPSFVPSFVPQDASKPGGDLQYNNPMPMNNNTQSQQRKPETKSSVAPTRPAASRTPSGFTSINGPGSRPTGVSKQGKMQALRLQYDDHRIQAGLAAAARDLSELKTWSGKNHAQTKDALKQIMSYCEAGSLNAVAMTQKLYAIDEKVDNNGEKQRVIGDNLIVARQEFQVAQEDNKNILRVIQAVREEARSAQEKSQSDIRALGEAVRIMSESQQCQFDEVTRRLEEIMRGSQRASIPQKQREHVEDVTTFPEESLEISVRAPEIARTKGPRRPKRNGSGIPPCDATVSLRPSSSSRILRSRAR